MIINNILVITSNNKSGIMYCLETLDLPINSL